MIKLNTLNSNNLKVKKKIELENTQRNEELINKQYRQIGRQINNKITKKTPQITQKQIVSNHKSNPKRIIQYNNL